MIYAEIDIASEKHDVCIMSSEEKFFGKKFQIKQISSLLLLLEEQKKKLIKEMVFLIKEHFPYILSIPGIGGNTAAGIIDKIGEISNFHYANSLLAFAGLNPLVYKSGKYNAKHTRIYKKGSSYLINTLAMLALTIINNDDVFNQYY